MASRRSSENAVFMLQADEIDAIDVEKIRRSTVGSRIALFDLEPDPRRISVTLFAIVDGHGEATSVRQLARDRFAEIRGESRDAASPRQVITDKRNPFEGKGFQGIHAGTSMQASYLTMSK